MYRAKKRDVQREGCREMRRGICRRRERDVERIRDVEREKRCRERSRERRRSKQTTVAESSSTMGEKTASSKQGSGEIELKYKHVER